MITVFAPDGAGEVVTGTDLAELVLSTVAGGEHGPLRDGDVVVVTSKVLSKAAGLTRAGDDREAAIDAEADRDNTVTGAEQAAAAKAARPTAEAKADAWRLAAEADDVPNGTQRAITLAFWQRGQDAVLAPYIEKYLTAAGEISRGEGE